MNINMFGNGFGGFFGFGNNNLQKPQTVRPETRKGIVVTDVSDQEIDFNLALMRSSQVTITDFVPPHFNPEILNEYEIINIEESIEKSQAWDFGSGLIIQITSDRILNYLNRIKDTLDEGRNPETGVGRYDGTDREKFKIRIMNQAQDIFKYNGIFKKAETDPLTGNVYALFDYVERVDIYKVTRERPKDLQDPLLLTADHQHHNVDPNDYMNRGEK